MSRCALVDVAIGMAGGQFDVHIAQCKHSRIRFYDTDVVIPVVSMLYTQLYQAMLLISDTRRRHIDMMLHTLLTAIVGEPWVRLAEAYGFYLAHQMLVMTNSDEEFREATRMDPEFFLTMLADYAAREMKAQNAI